MQRKYLVGGEISYAKWNTIDERSETTENPSHGIFFTILLLSCPLFLGSVATKWLVLSQANVNGFGLLTVSATISYDIAFIATVFRYCWGIVLMSFLCGCCFLISAITFVSAFSNPVLEFEGGLQSLFWGLLSIIGLLSGAIAVLCVAYLTVRQR